MGIWAISKINYLIISFVLTFTLTFTLTIVGKETKALATLVVNRLCACLI